MKFLLSYLTALAIFLSCSKVLARGSPVSPQEAEEAAAQENEEQRLFEEHKYFHEPGGPADDPLLGHYDSRYFRGLVSYEGRVQTQLHMVRAYLQTFRELGLDTWLAHGTLLGWWWNGKVRALQIHSCRKPESDQSQPMPWDWDLDTQVSGVTLDYMGQNLNRSTHKYTSSDGKVQKEYMLDVNPWIWERERGDGANVIDARWIDLSNGLFIDITGLSETHPDEQPGVWSCKNYHRYQTRDLYPMRESLFHGVTARIPYAYQEILVEEYQEESLVRTEWQG